VGRSEREIIPAQIIHYTQEQRVNADYANNLKNQLTTLYQHAHTGKKNNTQTDMIGGVLNYTLPHARKWRKIQH